MRAASFCGLEDSQLNEGKGGAMAAFLRLPEHLKKIS